MISQLYFDKIRTYFNGDTAKAWLWFKTPNPMLGFVSPLDMIKVGREKKVMNFIDNALNENKRI